MGTILWNIFSMTKIYKVIYEEVLWNHWYSNDNNDIKSILRAQVWKEFTLNEDADKNTQNTCVFSSLTWLSPTPELELRGQIQFLGVLEFRISVSWCLSACGHPQLLQPAHRSLAHGAPNIAICFLKAKKALQENNIKTIYAIKSVIMYIPSPLVYSRY